MRFRKREAPNYSLARNHKLLNNFVKRVLESRKDVFLDISDIIVKCNSKDKFDKFYERYLSEWNERGIEDIHYLSLLWDLYKDSGDIGILRGRFLELLLYYMLRNEYDEVDMRCYVANNGKESKKEVDVFGWNNKKNYGEFYECKVSYYKVDESEWIDYLDNLVEIDLMFGNKNIYGFASLEEDKAFFHFLKDIMGNKKGFNNALIIGKNGLYPEKFIKRKVI
ncbi:MAG: hypothetical protein PWP68_1758 [Rikenellaceae bacterium]|nr:hypothetical protein [Rikenellaceae bacterium]MDK2946824.1 hypothetical protein [Geotoga sp.]